MGLADDLNKEFPDKAAFAQAVASGVEKELEGTKKEVQELKSKLASLEARVATLGV